MISALAILCKSLPQVSTTAGRAVSATIRLYRTRCHSRNLKSSLSSRHETVFPKEFSFTEKSFPSTNSLFPLSFFFSLSFRFCYLLSDPPRGVSENKKLPHTLRAGTAMAPGVGFEPTRPEGHRLTGEPIPDMGPRDTQTARYQAPEPRLNEEPFERLFSLLGS